MADTKQQEFLNSIKQGAIDGWKEYSFLPSVAGAQAGLETGWGTSDIYKKANNAFGIKGHYQGYGYLGETWEDTGEENITIDAWFRHYPDVNLSIADHGEFFTSTPWRTENYKDVIGETDYKKVAHALRDSGYATDKNYADKLINIIETYDLVEWDKEVIAEEQGATEEDEVTYNLPEGKIYIGGVEHDIKEVKE